MLFRAKRVPRPISMPALRFELPVEHLAQSGRQVPKVHLSTPYDPVMIRGFCSCLCSRACRPGRPWPALATEGRAVRRSAKDAALRRCRADVVQMSCKLPCDILRLNPVALPALPALPAMDLPAMDHVADVAGCLKRSANWTKQLPRWRCRCCVAYAWNILPYWLLVSRKVLE